MIRGGGGGGGTPSPGNLFHFFNFALWTAAETLGILLSVLVTLEQVFNVSYLIPCLLFED
jgi:hypothetical protein